MMFCSGFFCPAELVLVVMLFALAKITAAFKLSAKAGDSHHLLSWVESVVDLLTEVGEWGVFGSYFAEGL